MHRSDKSKYLLYIEPMKEEKSLEPVNDIYTEVMENALLHAPSGTSAYGNSKDYNTFMLNGAFKGIHMTDCGETSTNRDYLLKSGHITNSLAAFYLRWYRNSIPETEMIKMAEVIKAYQ
jgi:hypothetical protein